LGQLIDETTKSHTPIVIASDGKPHVALLPLEDLIALES
jgi:prevent-host-death family protein